MAIYHTIHLSRTRVHFLPSYPLYFLRILTKRRQRLRQAELRAAVPVSRASVSGLITVNRLRLTLALVPVVPSRIQRTRPGLPQASAHSRYTPSLTYMRRFAASTALRCSQVKAQLTHTPTLNTCSPRRI
ncbi:hypothetical protein C8F01DRAFT_1251776 [Mycena amicta]|nr:hypothetical protein C8F01DRAFT_1251776 [Mycena amicta]